MWLTRNRLEITQERTTGGPVHSTVHGVIAVLCLVWPSLVHADARCPTCAPAAWSSNCQIHVKVVETPAQSMLLLADDKGNITERALPDVYVTHLVVQNTGGVVYAGYSPRGSKSTMVIGTVDPAGKCSNLLLQERRRSGNIDGPKSPLIELLWAGNDGSIRLVFRDEWADAGYPALNYYGLYSFASLDVVSNNNEFMYLVPPLNCYEASTIVGAGTLSRDDVTIIMWLLPSSRAKQVPCSATLWASAYAGSRAYPYWSEDTKLEGDRCISITVQRAAFENAVRLRQKSFSIHTNSQILCFVSTRSSADDNKAFLRVGVETTCDVLMQTWTPLLTQTRIELGEL